MVVVLGVVADGRGLVFHRPFQLGPFNTKRATVGSGACHRAHTHASSRCTHRMGVVPERHRMLVLVVLLLWHHHGHSELVLRHQLLRLDRAHPTLVIIELQTTMMLFLASVLMPHAFHMATLEIDAGHGHVSLSPRSSFLNVGNFTVFNGHFLPLHVLDVYGLVEADHALLHDAGLVAASRHIGILFFVGCMMNIGFRDAFFEMDRAARTRF
jgi:hypothetical protein